MEKKKKKRHWLLYHFPPEEKEKGKKTHVRQGNSRKWGNRYYYIKVGFGVFIWQSRWVWGNPSNALGTGCVERSPDSFRALVSPLEAESESDEEFLGKGGKRRKKGILRVFWACTIRVAHRTASFPLFSFFFARNFRVKLKGKGRSFSAPKIWRKTWETKSFLLGNIYNSWSDELAIDLCAVPKFCSHTYSYVNRACLVPAHPWWRLGDPSSILGPLNVAWRIGRHHQERKRPGHEQGEEEEEHSFPRRHIQQL